MATLILEQNGHRQAGVLQSRVVIGRRNSSHIVVPDRSVSRIHAWIGKADGHYFIADTGSRNGTRVNDQRVEGRRALTDGDRIQIGPATITFHGNGHLPPGVEQIDLSDRSLQSDDGIFLDCACGAPLWAPWDFAGRVGQCRYCGQMVAMPKDKPAGVKSDPNADTAMGIPSPVAQQVRTPVATRPAPVIRRPSARVSLFDPTDPPKPIARPVPSTIVCGACQSPISLLEETTCCPDCGVTFHTECWLENLGCSSYGCKQVGVLDLARADEASVEPEPVVQAADAQPSEPRSLLPYILLGAALPAALGGLLTFGIPPMLLGAAVIAAWVRRGSNENRRTFGTGLLVCVLSAIVGAGLSWYWWIAR